MLAGRRSKTSGSFGERESVDGSEAEDCTIRLRKNVRVHHALRHGEVRKSSAPLIGVLILSARILAKSRSGKDGVLVQDSKDAAAILKEKKPDASIITTASLRQDLKGPFMDCAESGVNAIPTGEEAFYPWNSSYKTTQLLGRLGQEERLYPSVAPDTRTCSGET